MARADYEAQLLRHVGEWDTLPNALVVPSAFDRSPDGASLHGEVTLSENVLHGNRWPAVSGALLAELAYRCSTLGALATLEVNLRAVPSSIEVHFRKAIPVADPRNRPRVASGSPVLRWTTAAESGPQQSLLSTVRMSRRPAETEDEVPTIEARAVFRVVACEPSIKRDDQLQEYLARLPQRMVLPAYDPGWRDGEISGHCEEPPGSLLAAAEQALGDAGKVVRGEGVPPEEDESMLLASMTYHWIEPIDDGWIRYVARAGDRRPDDRGRTWVDASATLTLDGRPVAQANGRVVFLRDSLRS